ncbi:MAG: enoyl-CoA hydratase [Dehalococcoidia bacterium]
MPSSVLLVEKSEGIATLTLNRPEAMNALSRELRQAIADGFQEILPDDSIRAAIITGAGRAFCAGMDLKEAAAGPSDQEAFAEEPAVMESMAAFDRPIIGAINGFAVTAGFELALACDILIASTEAKFADTHARVGMLPGWGLSQKLPRLIGILRAKEVSLTGNYITAEQAERWGLVNRVVPPDELLAVCRGLAADIAGCVPEVVSRYKRMIDGGYGMPFAEAMKYESDAAIQWARGITSGDIGSRRGQVQERGREQGGGS